MIENSHSENKKDVKTQTRRLGLFLLIPLLVGFAAICLLASEWQTSLRVKRIEIDGAHILPHHLLLEAVNVPTQSLLDTVDLYRIQKRLEEQPFVKTATVSRSYPDAIYITITEREPIASIGTTSLLYIDTAAVLLPAIETAVPLDLPIISGVPEVKATEIGKVIKNSEVQTAIELLNTAIKVDSSLYHFISEVDMKGGQDIEITTTEPPVNILVGRGDFLKKLFIFQKFWSQFIKSENVQNVQYFDLRFDDQVVVKWNSSNNNQ
jgi:cell division protein FtsQ